MSVDATPKVVESRLAARLRKERAKRQHTIRQAATDLDCSTESVRNWESAKRLPMKEKLLRIAAYIKVPPSEVTRIWVEDRKSMLRRGA